MVKEKTNKEALKWKGGRLWLSGYMNETFIKPKTTMEMPVARDNAQLPTRDFV